MLSCQGVFPASALGMLADRMSGLTAGNMPMIMPIRKLESPQPGQG